MTATQERQAPTAASGQTRTINLINAVTEALHEEMAGLAESLEAEIEQISALNRDHRVGPDPNTFNVA